MKDWRAGKTYRSSPELRLVHQPHADLLGAGLGQTGLLEQSVHDVVRMKIMEDVRGGPEAPIVQGVDEGAGVGSEAGPARREQLGRLDADLILHLNLQPGSVEESPASRVDDSCPPGLTAHSHAGLHDRVGESQSEVVADIQEDSAAQVESDDALR